MAAGDRTQAFWCPSDDEVVSEPAATYECSRCGFRTNSEELAGERARCSDCNIFMGKDGEGCPSCSEGLEEIEVIEDHDGSLVRVEDFVPDGPSLSERQEAEEDRRREQSRQAHLSAEARAERETIEVAWSEVRPGDLLPDIVGGNVEWERVTTTSRPRYGGDVVATITDSWGMGKAVSHPADESVRVKSPRQSGEVMEFTATIETAPRISQSCFSSVVIEADPRTGMVRVLAQRNNYYSALMSTNNPHHMREFAVLLREVVSRSEPDARPEDDDLSFREASILLWEGVDIRADVVYGPTWDDPSSTGYVFRSGMRSAGVSSGATLLATADTLGTLADEMEGLWEFRPAPES